MSTSGNILSLPFRKSTQISLASTIRQYINTKYDQHPDMFKQDLEVIDALRRDAVNVREPHPTGVAKLQTYAGQLVWIGGKFPIDIGAEFSWYPALGYSTERPLVVNNLKFELMNILYNLASLFSQLAINTPRGNTDGLKTAANYFSQAAGVFSHIKTAVLPELRMSDPPEDMDAETLESLTQLMLAQSQECFWQKAVMDGYKDASIAKLAARVSDLYNLASEAAVNSDAISSAWIHHMSAKHHHFAAAAQYRAACDCLEKRRYGEEVARLMDAVACVNEGIKETKSGYLNKTVAEDLQGLKKKVEEDLKRAEKDNDMIYLNPVPPKPELKVLDRANMAVARTPPQVANPYEYFGDQAEFGPALFSRLVPFSVHVATTIYEGRRDQLVNRNIIPELESMNEEMHNVLSSLDLPGSLQALEKPMGLPPSLQQHAEELRQADAISRVHKTFADIEKLRAADMAIFEEGKSMLVAEEEEDNWLRAKYGTERWTRPDSRNDAEGSSWWGLVDQFETWFAQSITSDNNVRKKFAAVEDVLAVLCGSTRGLTEYIPSSSSREMADELKPVVGRLRSAYSDILRLESRRRKKVEALREAARRDDIKPDILKEAARLERTFPNTALDAAHFEDFFDKRLDRLYEPEQEALQREVDDQQALVSEVKRVNKEFESQKLRLGNRGNKAREQALQRLDDAYFKYKDTVNNLEEGRNFYNQLNQHVGQQFRDPVKGWVGGRRMEARAHSEELDMPSLGNLNLSRGQAPPQSPPVANYGSPIPQAGIQRPAIHSPAAASIQSWGGNTEPVQQPQPVQPPANPMGGMWNPSMGIKFGGSGPATGATGGQGQGQGRGQGQQGQWNPNSGIKFG